MDDAVRVLAAMVPLVGGMVVAYSNFKRLLGVPAAEQPVGWRWQLQGPVFAVGLSPLLLASRTEEPKQVAVLVVTAAVSLFLLVPVLNSLVDEDRYFDMFRSAGGRQLRFKVLEPRWRIAAVCGTCFALTVGSSLYVVVQHP